jgi:tape measure domain-containing protein
VSVVANVAINVDSRGAVSKLRQVQTQATATERAFGGVTAAVGKLAAAFGAIQAAKFVFAKTAELESQSRSLQILAGSAEKAGRIIKDLQQLGAVTPFTSTELIDSAKRLQAFGVETDKVVETTRRLADASGATGAELSGLVTAYGQVQAKGRLQGEELLQFQERGIALQQELRKMYEMTGEEFQKALSKGQISAEAVESALVRLTNTGGKYANGAIAQSDTLNGRMSTLQDGITRIAQALGEVLSPALKAILAQAIGVVNSINSALSAGRRIQEFGIDAKQRNELFQQACREAEQIAKLRGGGRIDPAVFTQVRDERFRDLIETYGYRTGQVKPPETAPEMSVEVPDLVTPTTAGGGRSGGGGDSGREAQRAAEQMQQQIKAADDLNFELKNRLAIAQATESVAKRMLEYDIRQNEIAKEYEELKKAAKSADELILINANQVIEQRIAQIEAEQQINDLLAERAVLAADVVRQSSMPTVYNELETQDAALQAILDKYPAIGAAADAAATLATSSMSEMIAGTKSVEQAFAEFLNAIGDALINTAKQMIAQYIAIGIARMFAGLGGSAGGFAPSGPLAAVGNFNPLPTSFGRANGGPAIGGMPYMVGERGPELFVPGGSGGVMSNNDMRAAMGSRPGGANGSPVLNMSFQSTNINGVEYVSRDQLEQAMVATRRQAAKEGANRGMSMTLDKLQQSPSTRSRLGIGGR